MKLVDSHAHLDDSRFAADLPEVLRRARDAGVGEILTIACLGEDPRHSWDRVRAILDEETGIRAAAGVHPHDARYWSSETVAVLEEALAHPKVAAVGEIGLDYHYDNSPRDVQREVFQRQLELAANRGLPVIIHTREADADTVRLLRRHWEAHRPAGERVILHCFSGSEELAEAGREMGFYFGIGGVITFRKAERLRGVVAGLPLDRLLLETDCPYLAPEPKRGRRNEPAFLPYILCRLAEVCGRKDEEVARATTENFRRLLDPIAG
ncbi:MAG: hypothetical protein Kow00109_10150 [Acidobacteriota bacterium]